MNNKNITIIGLTGGIASGKSSVLEEFKKLGVKIISVDDVSREVFYSNGVKEKIQNSFKTLERKKIAEIIFSNSGKKRILERIMHPVIIRELKKIILAHRKKGKGMLVADVPLLFEAKLEKIFDSIIVVSCRKDQQIKRLAEREKISKREAVKRINSQIPLSEKVKMADFVIDNSKSKKELKFKIEKMLDKIIQF